MTCSIRGANILMQLINPDVTRVFILCDCPGDGEEVDELFVI